MRYFKNLKGYLLICFLSTACIPENKIIVSLRSISKLEKNVASISFSHNQVTITGQGLKEVTSLKLKNNNLDESFTIESATSNQIIANATRAISIKVGQAFDLILNSADGAATFPVTFSLDDKSVTASMLSSMGAGVGQILKYNGTTWVPSALPSYQLYLGSWNATTNSPDVNAASPQAGDYYIVATAGTQNLGTGAVTYAIGDWLMYNGTSWDKIANSTNSVSSFKGRSGVIVPATGDYTWSQITKTGSKLEDILDINITGRADQKVLKWDAGSSKWVMGDDLSGAGAFSGTPNMAVITSGTGALSSSPTSATELGYVAGVTSSIQTQINARISASAVSGDATLSGAGVLTLKNTGTAGTYTSVTTDAQGRVTAGTSGTSVASITGTAPVTIAGTATVPVISMAGATTVVDGYLKATDWTIFNSKQSALSAGATINGIVYPTTAAATLQIPLAPVQLTDAVNKQYVDSFGQWVITGSDIYRATGKVGIGTTTPTAKLEVAGAIVSTPTVVTNVATSLDLATSNTFTIATASGTAFTLTNMINGGVYTIAFTDTTSRTYTFGCTGTTKYKPANAPTTVGTTSLYTVLALKNGANYDCYVTWASGYQ